MRVLLRLADPGAFAPAQLEGARSLLDPGELAYLERCRHPRRRQEYLVGRALLRLALAEATGRPPEELGLGEGERGRPELEEAPADTPSFNLSHTQGLLVLALAPAGASVGVDLEHWPRQVELPRLARRQFAAAEQAAWASLEGEPARRRFFELWTLKEAYMKARGLGFALPSASFSFELEGGRVVGFTPESGKEGEANRWAFALAEPTAEHQLAVAAFTGGDAVALELEWVRALA